jgi:hypothetical protein
MAIHAKRLWLLLGCIPVLWLAGCSNFGKVDQGRVIAYDKHQGVVTIIRESTSEPPQPNVLPPLAIRVPQDPKEMGPPPEAGKRLQLDTKNNQLVFFDVQSETIKTINYTPLSVVANVSSDDPRLKGVSFPAIDRQKKTITLYSGREKKLVTLTVADQYFALPDDIWKSGDTVRYYYKDPSQALRLMNVTKTNIMKS